MLPILSLIILVATVCTFILAIGAYYHYKSKEGSRNTAQVRQPDFIQAELVTPAPLMSDQGTTYAGTHQYGYSTRVQDFVPGRLEQRPEYAGGHERKGSIYSETVYVKQGPTYIEKRQPGHKFMRFTQSGNLEPLTDVQVSKRTVANEVRWR
jgi:hypothetical protein